MNSMRMTILVLTAFAAFVPGSAQSAASATTLIAIVGPNDAQTITLTDQAGTRVTQLPPGDYSVEVRDNSAFHNFHLTGPNENRSTTVAFVGTTTWNVTLVDGIYAYQCDPHRTQMYDQFTVGTGRTPPPPTPGKLSASVGPGKRIALRNAAGAKVTSLTGGRFAITVQDATRADNFHLRGPGVDKASGVRFRGTVRWTVTLREGAYTYRSDRRKSLRGSFRVSAPS